MFKLVLFLYLSCAQYVLADAEFNVLAHFHHDAKTFTQGLEFYDGLLYESAGMYGSSSVQILHPDTGAVLKKHTLEKKYFGEGITVVNGRVYMLTWKEKTMFIFDASNLELIRTVSYQTHSGEGWGIAYDGRHLVVSDGSDFITFYELPSDHSGDSLIKVREIRVSDATSGRNIRRVNELEIINGYIYANIWYVDVIIKIDPSDGKILHTYDFRSLYPKAKRPKSADCFNGIAYNTSDHTLTLTGKYWPSFYRVKLPL